MKICRYIDQRGIGTPEESEIRFGAFPFRLGIEGLIPSFKGQNREGSIWVALYASEGKFEVVHPEACLRFEGMLDRDYPVLEIV